VRAGQTVELRVTPELVAIHAVDGQLLATHGRARGRGAWVIDATHWDGLPDGHTRATVLEAAPLGAIARRGDHLDAPPDQPLPHRRRIDIAVAARPLSDYAKLMPAASSR
jgi:hypothetical protein